MYIKICLQRCQNDSTLASNTTIFSSSISADFFLSFFLTSHSHSKLLWRWRDCVFDISAMMCVFQTSVTITWLVTMVWMCVSDRRNLFQISITVLWLCLSDQFDNTVTELQINVIWYDSVPNQCKIDVTVFQTSEQWCDCESNQCNNIVTVYQTSNKWCDCVSD